MYASRRIVRSLTGSVSRSATHAGARTAAARLPRRWSRGLVQATLLAGIAGCAGGKALNAPDVTPAAAPDPADRSPRSANVWVLQPPQLQLQQGGSVLDALRASLPAIRIADGGSACPAMSIRGPNPMPGMTEPKVYVDGAPATDTCVLSDLAAENVRRVEVYPQGVTTRPGYAPNGNGLILVFTRRAGDDLARTPGH